MDEVEQEQQLTQGVNIPIDWYMPENIQSIYASNVFVQPGEYEIALSFFETLLPILSGSPEENTAKLERLEAIQAKCVARIIVAPDLVPKLIQALQNGLNAYFATKGIVGEGGSK